MVGGIVGLSAFYFYRAVRQHSVADLYWINRFDDKTGQDTTEWRGRAQEAKRTARLPACVPD